MPNNTPLDEFQIEQLELSFPAASSAAFANAYQQALAAGLSVIGTDGDELCEVLPSGERIVLKTIAPPTPSQVGQKFTIP